MENCREIALNIISKILTQGAYSNIVLNSEIKKSKLNDNDKSLVTQIVYGTVKYKYTIDIILEAFIKRGIKSVDVFILNILRMSIFQLKYLDKIPDYAVVNEAVLLCKKSKTPHLNKFVNAVLRNYLRAKDIPINEIHKENEMKRLAYKYSFEEWMVELFKNQYGDNIERILEGSNSIPGLTLRINTNKSDIENTKKMLIDKEYSITNGVISSQAINISNGGSIENNPLFQEGFISPQDESAMLVAESMEIEKDMIVLDLCSAPGGKTTQIGELMKNTGKIYACDIKLSKLELVRQNISRLGLSNIECLQVDATKPFSKFIEFADRVLIDVPCSGLGIIRKKPEIKWSKKLSDFHKLIETQRQILNNCANYVKINGILLYSTCTLNKNENEANIKWFLSRFPNYEIEPLYFGDVDNIQYDIMGTATILPSKDMDGFFMAKMRRRS